MIDFKQVVRTGYLRRMPVMVALVAALCTVGAGAQCATLHLAVIVNKASAVDSLSTSQLRRLMLGDVRNWPDQKPVRIVARELSSPVAQCLLSKVVRLSDSEYNRYLMSAEFRGEEPITTQTANSDALAVKIVGSSVSAFAVVDATTVAAAGGAVKVIHINGKLPGEAGYSL